MGAKLKKKITSYFCSSEFAKQNKQTGINKKKTFSTYVLQNNRGGGSIFSIVFLYAIKRVHNSEKCNIDC